MYTKHTAPEVAPTPAAKKAVQGTSRQAPKRKGFTKHKRPQSSRFVHMVWDDDLTIPLTLAEDNALKRKVHGEVTSVKANISTSEPDIKSVPGAPDQYGGTIPPYLVRERVSLVRADLRKRSAESTKGVSTCEVVAKQVKRILYRSQRPRKLSRCHQFADMMKAQIDAYSNAAGWRGRYIPTTFHRRHSLCERPRTPGLAPTNAREPTHVIAPDGMVAPNGGDVSTTTRSFKLSVAAPAFVPRSLQVLDHDVLADARFLDFGSNANNCALLCTVAGAASCFADGLEVCDEGVSVLWCDAEYRNVTMTSLHATAALIRSVFVSCLQDEAWWNDMDLLGSLQFIGDGLDRGASSAAADEVRSVLASHGGLSSASVDVLRECAFAAGKMIDLGTMLGPWELALITRLLSMERFCAVISCLPVDVLPVVSPQWEVNAELRNILSRIVTSTKPRSGIPRVVVGCCPQNEHYRLLAHVCDVDSLPVYKPKQVQAFLFSAQPLHGGGDNVASNRHIGASAASFSDDIFNIGDPQDLELTKRLKKFAEADTSMDQLIRHVPTFYVRRL